MKVSLAVPPLVTVSTLEVLEPRPDLHLDYLHELIHASMV
jgi:hypothetical protein